MSFFNKFKSLVQGAKSGQVKSPDNTSNVQNLITKLIHPTLEKDREIVKDQLVTILSNQTSKNIPNKYSNQQAQLFQHLSQQKIFIQKQSRFSYYQNWFTSFFLSQLLKETPFNCLKTQDNDDTDRLTTEASTSSFYPQAGFVKDCKTPREHPLQLQQKNTSKQEQVIDKRNDRIQLNLQLTQPKQPHFYNKNVRRITSIQFAKGYYVYLQRLASNGDLMNAIKIYQYPFTEDQSMLEPKMKFLWLYKLQNLCGVGLSLIEKIERNVSQIQKLIWYDVLFIWNFLKREILQIANNFGNLTDEDVLSLHEIHQYTQNQEQYLVQFQQQGQESLKLPQLPVFPELSDSLKKQVFEKANRVKALNDYAFKRNIKQKSTLNHDVAVDKTTHLRQRSGCPIINLGQLKKARETYDKENFNNLQIDEEIVFKVQNNIKDKSFDVCEMFDQNDYQKKYEIAVCERLMTDQLNQQGELMKNNSGIFQFE